MNTRIVFIGAGRMATAIVQGLLKNRYYLPEEIACTCGNNSSGPRLAEKTGIQYHKDITPAVYEAETVVLACKPQQFNKIDGTLVDATKGKLLLSILAGTPLTKLNAKFSTARNSVRTMPNTPGQIGSGVTAYASHAPLEPADRKIVEQILCSLGNFHEVNESDLDAVTALSGSGPAYVFEFAAALRNAGIHCGLSQELSASLTIDTLLGAAKLLANSEDSPEALRDAVTSPGGTTAAALKVLEENNFRKLIEQTLAAAKARSIQLSQE
ncbi:MAG: pyrroline-5-carboxylate reductase [Zhongshania aliphaticivorans]|jgi:pyrroline-5-carboxylate reductase